MDQKYPSIFRLSSFSDWGKTLLINFLLVATVGVVMRYKIAYSLPFVDQKFLQHGHSHFAFSGWVTQALMVLLVYFLNSEFDRKISQYGFVLKSHLLISYLMLLSFSLSGYSFISTSLSFLSIIVFIVFAVKFYQDTKRERHSSLKWFYTAFLLGIVSTVGTIGVGYIKSAQIFDQNIYLSSIYFYLHFQYNGWFFFCIMGLLVHYLIKWRKVKIKDLLTYYGFLIAVIPTYGLSLLWLNLPNVVLGIIGIAALIQLGALAIFIKTLWSQKTKLIGVDQKAVPILLFFSLIALIAKIILQLVSVWPEISQLAFGFRPIVIAYLHLVLLAFTSVILLALLHAHAMISIDQQHRPYLSMLLVGIFLNEAVLAAQGFLSFDYSLLPYSNEGLLIISSLIWVGLLGLLIKQFSVKRNEQMIPHKFH